MKGLLTLIESKNAPVFEPRGVSFPVNFQFLPIADEPFIFGSEIYGLCHTSTLKTAELKDGAYILLTRNSIYKLQVK